MNITGICRLAPVVPALVIEDAVQAAPLNLRPGRRGLAPGVTRMADAGS